MDYERQAIAYVATYFRQRPCRTRKIYGTSRTRTRECVVAAPLYEQIGIGALPRNPLTAHGRSSAALQWRALMERVGGSGISGERRRRSGYPSDPTTALDSLELHRLASRFTSDAGY